jgi:hypothetical protein
VYTYFDALVRRVGRRRKAEVDVATREPEPPREGVLVHG